MSVPADGSYGIAPGVTAVYIDGKTCFISGRIDHIKYLTILYDSDS